MVVLTVKSAALITVTIEVTVPPLTVALEI